MAWQQYIQINGLKYSVVDDGGQSTDRPVYDRFRSATVGLTGYTILQDFTVAPRSIYQWGFLLRVYTNTPTAARSDYGTLADIRAALDTLLVNFVEHEDTNSHTVTIMGEERPVPRTGANIQGECNGEHYVNVNLLKVHEAGGGGP